MSFHPTTTNQEIEFVCNSIKELASNFKIWQKEYQYNNQTNEFDHNGQTDNIKEMVANWFAIS
jgi:hypothetical protein